jgi:hypothetical protein
MGLISTARMSTFSYVTHALSSTVRSRAKTYLSTC